MRSLTTLVYALAAAWAAFTLTLLVVPRELAAVGGLLMLVVPIVAFLVVVSLRRRTA